MPREVLESLFMNGLRVFALFCFLLCSLPGPKFANYVSGGTNYTLLWSLTVSGDVHFHLNIQERRLRRAHQCPTALLRRASSKIHIVSPVFPTSPTRPLSSQV